MKVYEKDKKNIIVRKARKEDIPELIKMTKDFGWEYKMMITRDNPKVKKLQELRKDWLERKEKWFFKLVRARNSATLVAVVDGELAGYTIIQIKRYPPTFKIERYGYFSFLYVKPEFRGKGVSSALFNAGKDWFKRKGLQWIAINVDWANTHARRIYEHWGFFPMDMVMWRKI